MKVEYINPFVESVFSLCETMLSCTVQRGQLTVSSGSPADDVTALIGLSGPARGTVALSFPLETARAMVARLLHLDVADLEDSVSDGVAELVNIVAGSAKARLHNGKGQSVIALGLPTVVSGKNYSVDYPSQTTWLDVPFNSELGAFKLRVTFEYENGKGTHS